MDDARSKPPCNKTDALAVVQALRAAGHIAYFAGGCVRDVLLGIEPKDYDVATDALPGQVRQIFRNSQAAGAAFGVILVRLGKSVVEIATFRSDGKYTDGRHPEKVTFTTPQEDARRRDFTINGLFLDPANDQIIDFVGGQEDLKGRILRAIGDPDARFSEDYLRMLRAVRFAARFDLSIDPATHAAIQKHAAKLIQISPERIADELRGMLPPPTRVRASELLWSLGLLPVIFRKLSEGPSRDEPGQLFVQLAPGEPTPFALALAALAVDFLAITKHKNATAFLITPEIRRIVQACRSSLKISNDESDLMQSVLELESLLGNAPPTVAKMKRFLAQACAKEARQMMDALMRSEAQASGGLGTAPPTGLLQRIEWLDKQFAVLEKEPLSPVPLLNGDELIAAGYRPGPQFKKVLDEVYDAQLEDRITDRAQAMAMARDRLEAST